jgi:hypothetical protein
MNGSCCGGQSNEAVRIGEVSTGTLTLTLARALTYKKRVLERIALVENDIRTSNSVQVGIERESDVAALVEERASLVAHLIELKSLIARANGPIQRDIFSLAESKGEIAFLRSVNTFNGPRMQQVVYGQPAETVQYEAVIRKADVDKANRELTAQIDSTQERIEKHNYNTSITIKDLGLTTGA